MKETLKNRCSVNIESVIVFFLLIVKFPANVNIKFNMRFKSNGKYFKLIFNVCCNHVRTNLNDKKVN